MNKQTKYQLLTAGISGFLFALGLGISGMTLPQKIIGFLDVSSANWDPSLLFVMIGALAIHAPVSLWMKKKSHPLLDQQMHLPTKTKIDSSIVIGAVLFGLGWGIAGFCPGPALVSMTQFSKASSFIFVAAMVLGIVAHHYFQKSKEKQKNSQAS
ncbi:MAG: hypothetical protein COT73_12360 [Bdellovibrio sp. CG10_big_fil_rev_8_21_14_0_10_47_8]|nr:MAG: hypothetical protein COT73_12360 [Bdellovibrio sp. CG10_big_fil_rev_8_21_14_0_10_47_8]